MKTCANCATENVDDAQFCSNCGRFLEWGGSEEAPAAIDDTALVKDTAATDEPIGHLDAVEPLETQSVVTIAAVEAPARLPQTTVVSPPVVTLEPVEVRLEVGRSASIAMQVSNPNDTPESYVIGIAGTPSRWGRVDPRTVDVMPRSEAAVIVTLEPPRSPETAAGTYEVRLGAESQNHAATLAWATATVDIAPFDDLWADLSPVAVVAPRSARYNLRLTNSGNVATDVTLAPAEGSPFKIEVTPRSVHLEPGASAAARVKAAGRRFRWTGVDRSPISVQVSTASSTRTMDAVFEHHGVFAGSPSFSSFAAFGAGVGLAIVSVASGLFR